MDQRGLTAARKRATIVEVNARPIPSTDSLILVATSADPAAITAAMRPRLPPAVWALLLMLIAGTVYGVARGLRHRDLVDFEVYSRAGNRVLAHAPLYRPDDGHYQFKYLPLFALAVVPFARIDQETAKAVWFVMSFGLLVAFVRRSVRALPDRRMSEVALAWLAVLFVGRFYVKELILGQANIIFGLLLILALTAVQARRSSLAGILVGLATFVKPYGVVFLPWLAVAGGIAALASAAVVLVVGVALPAVSYGWSGNLALLNGWYQTVTSTTPENLLFGENISLATMWAKWVGPGRAATILATACGIGLLALVGWAWSRRASVNEPNYLEFAMLMALVPLLSPQGWNYVLVLATPAVILLIDRLRDLTWPWRVLSGAAVAVAGLTIYDLIGRAIYSSFLQWSLVSVAAIVFVVSLTHLRMRALA